MRILELHAPYFRALWRRDHEVLSWGQQAHCDIRTPLAIVRLPQVLESLPAGWEPDLILFGDDSRPLQVLGLERAPCPLVMLSIDAHHHVGWHAPLAVAFDLVFVAQRDLLPAFEAAGAAGARWLPLWAPDDLPRPRTQKSFQIAFVGSLNPAFHANRVALLGKLRHRLPLHAAEGAYADVFTRSRIVLNETVKGDLNSRVFEAMACGAMLLTEGTGNGLLELFADGEELVTYSRGDAEAVVERATYYLGAEAERAAIAAHGCERVRAGHLESHRAQSVLQRVADHLPARRPAAARHAGLARAYCALAERVRRYAEVAPVARPLSDMLRREYLAEATALAIGTSMEEPDRSAILGMVALERGDLSGAEAHLAWVVDHGGSLEDRLMHIAALLERGSVTRARDAAGALCAAHPGFAEGRSLSARLSALAAL